MKRGRPRKFDPNEGAAIAQRLFASRGYDAVGISEICDEVGITPTSLYAAYKNKFGLYQSSVACYTKSSFTFFDNALKEAQSSREVWVNLLYGAVECYATGEVKGCMILDGMLTSQDPEVQAFIIAEAEKCRQSIIGRLRELGDAEAEIGGTTIFAIMRGLSASARTGVAHATLKQVVDLLINRTVDTSPTQFV